MIVTDSLHAHILGVMLGIPTVATDNSYGKLRGTFDAFTHSIPLARWAETPGYGTSGHQRAVRPARRSVASKHLRSSDGLLGVPL